jgi:hypothetical protein
MDNVLRSNLLDLNIKREDKGSTDQSINEILFQNHPITECQKIWFGNFSELSEQH